jgi:hypothetical protein
MFHRKIMTSFLAKTCFFTPGLLVKLCLGSPLYTLSPARYSSPIALEKIKLEFFLEY